LPPAAGRESIQVSAPIVTFFVSVVLVDLNVKHQMPQELSLPLPPPRLGISPLREMGAYEALWDREGASFKTISKALHQFSILPSELIPPAMAEQYGSDVSATLSNSKIDRFGVRVWGTWDYPDKLKDAEYPVGVLYYRGCWDFIYSRCVSVVGTRTPSQEGFCRARKLVRALVDDDFTIVSGLAKGIDHAAHQAAIDAGGRTIAVIGTPIHRAYPAENKALQEHIAREHLLISQVPVCRWQRQHPRQNRIFFPERNIVISALSEATIIVEADEMSGTLVTARHALKQGRKLFILENCFNNTAITWPQRFLEAGAIRVREYADIRQHLCVPTH